MVPVEELYNCTPSLWPLDYCITYNCFNFFYIEEVNNEGAIHAKQNVLKREHGCTAAFVSYSIDAFMIWHLEFIMCVCNIVQWKKNHDLFRFSFLSVGNWELKNPKPFPWKKNNDWNLYHHFAISNHIILTWILNHIGIHGNTLAEEEAKDTLKNPFTDFKPFIAKYILKCLG